MVFLHQHQIIAVKIYFFQWPPPVERLIDGLATAQHEQIFAQYGGEADVQELFGGGDFGFVQAVGGIELMEGG